MLACVVLACISTLSDVEAGLSSAAHEQRRNRSNSSDK